MVDGIERRSAEALAETAGVPVKQFVKDVADDGFELGLADDATLEEIAWAFSHDRFATETCEPVLLEARPGYCKLRMDIQPHQLNAHGSLMGGAMFTVCDFAFGIAASIGQPATVSTSCSIDFLTAPKTDAIEVECTIEKNGRTLCFGKACVRDLAGNLVARMNVTGFHKR